MKIKEIHIKNFRGIKEINLNFKDLSMLIGNNGTSKTSILEAIHFALSSSFLSGRVKHTDFHLGSDEPIEITLFFDTTFKAFLPDGFSKQEVLCNKVYLRVKRREKAAPLKAFSDIVVVEHCVIPVEPSDNGGWKIPRKGSGFFKFDKRLLSFPVETDGLPRSYFYGKNRERQLQRGYNSSITSVFDDFNWRFSKSLQEKSAIKESFNKNHQDIEKQILDQLDEKSITKTFDALNAKLSSLQLQEIVLSFIDPKVPFDSAFLAHKIQELNIPVSHSGSGIEMIVSLLFLETLASLSKDNLIILIDEPELHLHPLLQGKFSRYLAELSQTNQVVLSTHSPYFFRNSTSNKVETEFLITTKTVDSIEAKAIDFDNKIFEWSPTWGEINYFAYDLPTIEFHNELYGHIQNKTQMFREVDVEKYFVSQSVSHSKKWVRVDAGQAKEPNNVTLMTYIRNFIHHPENTKNTPFEEVELKSSIEVMIDLIRKNSNLTS